MIPEQKARENPNVAQGDHIGSVKLLLLNMK
jgi:hypothetical protein